MMALMQQKRDQNGSSLMVGILGGGVPVASRPGRGLQNPAVRTHLPLRTDSQPVCKHLDGEAKHEERK